MKTKSLIILIAATSLLITGCKKDNSPKLLNPNATISIRPAKGVKLKAEAEMPGHLSALEIVKQTSGMRYQNRYQSDELKTRARGFSEGQKDLNPDAPRLKMWGTDIISAEGELESYFIDAQDVVLERVLNPFTDHEQLDTIAYLPNATLRKAAQEIREAYAKSDFEKVYKLFNAAYTFMPITGAEWRALKAEGKQ